MSGNAPAGPVRSVSSYLLNIRKASPLTQREEKALAARIRRGDHLALKTLVEANLKFVVKVCLGYRNRGVPLEDLISEGNLGLVKAAQRFNGDLDFKFISYAVWWIRQAILSALAGQSRFQVLSLSRVGLIRRVTAATRALEHALGRHPDAGEVAAKAGLSEATTAECLVLATAPLRLDESSSPDGPPLGDGIEDKEGVATDASALAFLARNRLNEALASLSPRSSSFLRLRFGLGQQASFSMDTIQDLLGLSRERLRQIQKQSLGKLRHHLESSLPPIKKLRGQAPSG